MRSGVMWRLVLFVLAAGNDPVRASGATRGLPTDDKVAIVLKPSELLLGSCPKLPGAIMHVRLQSLKTKSGTIFRRKAITADVFACVAASGSQPLAAGNIVECSEKAVVAGLKMFRWGGGNCTGYTKGIPVNIARCAGAGSVVLYSMDVQAESPVVSNITFAFSSSSTINATWDVTPKFCFFVAYRVNFYNNDTTVSHKLATVGFGTVSSCAKYPLTVTAVDANSAVMGPAATVKVVMPKALELSLNLTHGVTAVKASWRAEYTCNPNKEPAMIAIESYSVTLGDQTETTSHSTFEFIFDRIIERCNDSASTLTAALNEVTCMALDDTGAQLGNVTATLTDNKIPGRRYYSDQGNCMFYQKLEETPGGVGFTFDQLQDFCQNTMFSQMFTGEYKVAYFLRELAKWENLTQSVFATPHFLGLKRNSASGKWMWMWLIGHEMTVGDSVWDSGEPSSAGDCAELKANKKVAAVSCNATNRATVCYDCI